MRVTYGVVGKMGHRIKGRNSHEAALNAGQGVAHRTKNGEAQGRAPFEGAKITPHRHMMVDRGGDNWNEHHHTGHHTGCDHPGREGTTDKMVHSVPAVENCQSPEAENTQIVTVDRTAENFRNQVIGRS